MATKHCKKKSPSSAFQLGSVRLGGALPLFILGPCVIEGERSLIRAARTIAAICHDLGAEFIFKASYDKANRTSGDSYRGLGARDGCQMLAAAGAAIGAPVTTDIHSPEEAEIAAEFIDLLQIPAFLCRQTDLIEAAAKTGRAVNVKKGQFLAPWDVIPIAGKLRAAGCRDFCFTERGTTFGYNNLVADMRSLYWIAEAGFPVIFDATHSVQRPGGGGGYTTGDGHLAPVLARAAMAAGVDGIFLETHENPAEAPSDGPNQIPHKKLPQLLKSLLAIRRALGCFLLLPTFLFVCAQAAVDAREQSTNTASTNTPISGKMDLPVPVGEPIKGLKIPQYDDSGNLIMSLTAEEARKLDDLHVELKGLKIVFHDTERKEIRLSIAHGILNLESKILLADSETTIHRIDFEMIGSSGEFDTLARRGRLKGHIHAVFHDGNINQKP